jgi:hypothetical protein
MLIDVLLYVSVPFLWVALALLRGSRRLNIILGSLCIAWLCIVRVSHSVSESARRNAVMSCVYDISAEIDSGNVSAVSTCLHSFLAGVRTNGMDLQLAGFHTLRKSLQTIDGRESTNCPPILHSFQDGAE